MATASVTASLYRGRCAFLFCVIFLGSFLQVYCYTPDTLRVTCRDTIDLRGLSLESGLVVSELPERIPIYPNEDQYCDIFLSFSEGSEMMFYFDNLDLHSSGGSSRCDSTNVEFFDGSANMPVKGLDGKICGRQEEMPTGVYYVLNNLLIIRANSMGDVQGSGFRLHFTVYRKGFPCNREEFSCENYDAHSGAQGFKRCIDEQLVCDEWNDCGDWADEQQNCNDLSPGAIAAIVLVAVGIIALVVGLIVFCKIRRQREVRRLGEKEAAVMRDTSFGSSRGGGGMMSPFSISNETIEKEKYIPRYSTGRNSARRGQTPRAPDYDENPPPYTEKPSLDHSGDEGLEVEERPRSRQQKRPRDREMAGDEVFTEEGEEEPRMRRGRSRSQESAPREDRYLPRDDRHPSRRDERDSPRSDRYSRDRDDRRPARDDRSYPSRRDDQDSPPTRREDRDKDRPPSRHDQKDRDRERDRDRTPSRYDDRDRDRPPSRYDERDRDRDRERPPSSRYDDRDREKDYRRERPTSSRGPPEDRYSSGKEDDTLDQLHPLRDLKRRSLHGDSDPDTSREEKRASRDHSREDDRYPSRDDDRYPPRDDRKPHDSNNHHRHHGPRDDRERREDLHPPSRGRDDERSSPRGSDREDRPPPRDRDDYPPPPRDRNAPRGSSRDDRPGPEERQRERQSSHHRPHSSRTPDDNYEDVQFSGRPPHKGSPPPRAEEDPEDSPPRNRRRRSRSNRQADDREEERERGGRGRGGEEGGRPRASYGGFKEESV